MFKDNGLGKISYTNKELGDKINMPESTISKCNRELLRTQYFQIMNNPVQRNSETGCPTQVKVFNLDALGQALVCTAINHEERITTNEATIEELKAIIAKQDNDIELLKHKVFELPKSEPIIL